MRLLVASLVLTAALLWSSVGFASSVAAKQKRERAVVLARQQLGTPYVFGAEAPRRAFDCSGLTRWIMGKLGVWLPHFAASQGRMGKRVLPGHLKPGDLVFFNDGGHVGLYIGKGRVIHASSEYGRVVVAPLRSGWLGRAFDQARRFIFER